MATPGSQEVPDIAMAQLAAVLRQGGKDFAWDEPALEGISNHNYVALKEILQAHVKPETIRDIQSLPAAVGTLKNNVKKRLPLLQMRKAPVMLRSEKLMTDRAARAGYEDVKDAMYFGMAILVDAPQHPWNSMAWASSIRSTYGQFAHYNDGSPIFPSDFVLYDCHKVGCPTCSTNPSNAGKRHKGRVVEVWHDQRKEPLTTHDAIVIRVEPIANLASTKASLSPYATLMKGYPHEEVPHNEFVLIKDQRTLVAEDHIIGRIESAVIDYSFGSAVSLEKDAQLPQAAMVIRRKCNVSLRRFFPIVKSNPIRGELEILESTRQALADSLDRKDIDILAVPLILFADGFGLYRTMHKSIMGIYHSNAALKRADRLRQMNVMPLTLGPHGSNDTEVWEQIGSKLRELEQGCIIRLHGKPVFVYGYVFVMVGDFPQQQENSGFRRPTANQGCRFCDVTLTDRGNLDFDLTSGEHQRHHHEILRQREFLRTLRTRKLTSETAAQFGLAIDDPALMSILPAIDIIKTRPADAAHSELGGLTKMLHLIIVDRSLRLRLIPSTPKHCDLSLFDLTGAKPNYVKAAFQRAVVSAFRDELQGLFGTTAGVEPADIIIKVLTENIKYSRRLFRGFVAAAAYAASSRRPSAERRTVGPPETALPTVASGTGAIESGPSAIGAAIAIQEEQQLEDPRTAMESVELTTAKASKYKLWMSRPNIHIGLHYGDVMNETWKKVVYTTNHRSPEKDLFAWENFAQTLRFVLLDAFADTDQILTAQMKLIHETVPTLFSRFLKGQFEVPGIEDAEEAGNAVIASISSADDDDHRNVATASRLKLQVCRELSLPIKESDMDASWMAMLTRAYEHDYGRAVTIMGTRQVLKWWKKVSWSEKDSQSRVTKGRGQYVEYMDSASVLQYGRLDQIFTHDARRVAAQARSRSGFGPPNPYGPGLGFDPARDPNKPQMIEADFIGKRVDLPPEAYNIKQKATRFTFRPGFNSK
ncbi:hypothetical protein DL767_005311 [Monosporascus sp. MG133]|nr:hypothetical protein DL767_005311 [Monosporascus sp. MG133]